MYNQDDDEITVESEGWRAHKKAQEEITKLRRELEEIKELHRIQIAAICSATLQNTDSSVNDRIKPDNLYWSVAYGDVCNAIDREIKERKRADELEGEKRLLTACEATLKYERKRADLNERAYRMVCGKLQRTSDYCDLPVEAYAEMFLKLAQESK